MSLAVSFPEGPLCPVCGGLLVPNAAGLACAAGHQFDRAKQGYVNLLAQSHGSTKRVGDDVAMLQARRRFLDSGAYDPLAAALIEQAAAAAAQEDNPVVVDVGCGEGCYLARVHQALPQARCHGTDLSKDAVRLAAGAHKGCRFYVADTARDVCFATGTVDVLLNVFAPRNGPAFARVLKDNGRVVVVVPQDDHLHELRALVPMLGIEPEKRARAIETLAPALALDHEQELRFAVSLAGTRGADLVAMTPSARHLEAGAPLASTLPAAVTASMRLLVFQKA